MITLVNAESNEILDEQANISNINAVIGLDNYHSKASIKDREVVKNTDIPNLKRSVRLWGSFLKAVNPIRIINGTFETYDGETVNQVFYSVMQNHVDELDDTIPFSNSS